MIGELRFGWNYDFLFLKIFHYRVFTCNSVSGTLAEFAVCNAMHTFPLPDNLTFDEGSALGIPYFTVIQ